VTWHLLQARLAARRGARQAVIRHLGRGLHWVQDKQAHGRWALQVPGLLDLDNPTRPLFRVLVTDPGLSRLIVTRDKTKA